VSGFWAPPLALAVFFKRPQAEVKSALKEWILVFSGGPHNYGCSISIAKVGASRGERPVLPCRRRVLINLVMHYPDAVGRLAAI
jgi:hypothetical protein